MSNDFTKYDIPIYTIIATIQEYRVEVAEKRNLHISATQAVLSGIDNDDVRDLQDRIYEWVEKVRLKSNR